MKKIEFCIKLEGAGRHCQDEHEKQSFYYIIT